MTGITFTHDKSKINIGANKNLLPVFKALQATLGKSIVEVSGNKVQVTDPSFKALLENAASDWFSWGKQDLDLGELITAYKNYCKGNNNITLNNNLLAALEKASDTGITSNLTQWGLSIITGAVGVSVVGSGWGALAGLAAYSLYGSRAQADVDATNFLLNDCHCDPNVNPDCNCSIIRIAGTWDQFASRIKNPKVKDNEALMQRIQDMGLHEKPDGYTCTGSKGCKYLIANNGNLYINGNPEGSGKDHTDNTFVSAMGPGGDNTVHVATHDNKAIPFKDLKKVEIKQGCNIYTDTSGQYFFSLYGANELLPNKNGVYEVNSAYDDQSNSPVYFVKIGDQYQTVNVQVYNGIYDVTISWGTQATDNGYTTVSSAGVISHYDNDEKLIGQAYLGKSWPQSEPKDDNGLVLKEIFFKKGKQHVLDAIQVVASSLHRLTTKKVFRVNNISFRKTDNGDIVYFDKKRGDNIWRAIHKEPKHNFYIATKDNKLFPDKELARNSFLSSENGILTDPSGKYFFSPTSDRKQLFPDELGLFTVNRPDNDPTLAGLSTDGNWREYGPISDGQSFSWGPSVSELPKDKITFSYNQKGANITSYFDDQSINQLAEKRVKDTFGAPDEIYIQQNNISMTVTGKQAIADLGLFGATGKIQVDEASIFTINNLFTTAKQLSANSVAVYWDENDGKMATNFYDDNGDAIEDISLVQN